MPIRSETLAQMHRLAAKNFALAEDMIDRLPNAKVVESVSGEPKRGRNVDRTDWQTKSIQNLIVSGSVLIDKIIAVDRQKTNEDRLSVQQSVALAKDLIERYVATRPKKEQADARKWLTDESRRLEVLSGDEGSVREAS